MVKRSKQKRGLSLIQLLCIIGGIFLIVSLFLINVQQRTNTKALPATALSFTPATTSKSPMSLSINKPQTISIVLNPGTNQVSYAKVQIIYDATKLSIPTGAITAILPSFSILESSYSPGNIHVAFSIGSDTANIITLPTTIASIQLTPIGKTSKLPTQITFGGDTLILSVGATDNAYENVLSSTSPFYAKISQPRTKK